MLKIDPTQRPSATSCLEHPFFTGSAFAYSKVANAQKGYSKSTEKTQISLEESYTA
jgi:hypothetical protein